MKRSSTWFTPTCVGTLERTPTMFLPSQVHPHVRGDIYIGVDFFKHARGSPPRAWGHCI